jgi:hypothetical protein
MERTEVERWIRSHVRPTGEIETAWARPWATVLRVPVADGFAWCKVCGPVQQFEPRLTVSLAARWPDRVSEVLAVDEGQSWLLLADAGTSLAELGNPPDAWLEFLPRYAELQRGEAARSGEHLAGGVPDLRLATLPERYAGLLDDELPLAPGESARLRAFAPRFAELCAELAEAGPPDTIQHGDLHMANLFTRADRTRLIDWGDASVSHPFASLVETFRFLEQRNGLPATDPWFRRLRDAYLEPWGAGAGEAFALGLQVGTFAHAIAWTRQRDALPSDARADFDTAFRTVLLRVLACTHGG